MDPHHWFFFGALKVSDENSRIRIQLSPEARIPGSDSHPKKCHGSATHWFLACSTGRVRRDGEDEAQVEGGFLGFTSHK